jgi:hypothetical protein
MGSRPTRRTRTEARPGFLSRIAGAVLLCIAGLWMSQALAQAVDPPHEALDHFPKSRVMIDAGGRSYPIQVWMATTDERREQGLMYVRHLAPDHGMLFVFEYPQILNFWMKNTRIPLDLLFIAKDGRVIRIAENAEPESLATINSMGAALGVLELAGGSAARLGLRPGIRIVHPAFGAH